MRVHLDEAEAAKAIDIGRRRAAWHTRTGAQHRYGKAGEADPDTDVQAAGAECAVAKALGRPWDPDPERPGRVDIQPDIQVRQTAYPKGRLPIYESDRDDDWFFLAVGVIPDFEVVGYLRGSRARAVGVARALDHTRPPVIAVDQRLLTMLKADRDFDLVSCPGCGREYLRPHIRPDWSTCLRCDLEARRNA